MSSCRTRWPLVVGGLGVLALLALLLLVLLPTVLAFLVRTVPHVAPTPLNALLAFLLAVVLVCPLTVGYGFLLLSVSFIFGWRAFPILYSGSVLGAWIWFGAARAASRRWRWSSRAWRLLMERFPSVGAHSDLLVAIQGALDTEGMKVCSLLQLGVLPYGWLNLLMAVSPGVRFAPDFVVSTLVSRLKILNYVWIASSVRDVAELVGGEKKRRVGPQGRRRSCTREGEGHTRSIG